MGDTRVAEMLIKIGSLSFSPKSPFKYASGIFSPIYIDCRRISSYPSERNAIMDVLVEQIDSHIGRENIDTIAGTASSGISLATYVSERLGKPMVYVRPGAKSHGKGKQIEGDFESGKRALLLTDIISTENSVPEAVGALKSAGVEVVACFAIHDNCIGGIHKFLSENNIPLYALTDLKEVLYKAAELGHITPAEKGIIESWSRNPEKWYEERSALLQSSELERKRKVSGVLLGIGAITLSPLKPYCFKSGVLSPIYTDNRLLMSHPKEWAEVIDAFANAIVNQIGRQNIDVIAGVDSAGIPHAAYLSSRLNLPMAYIKSEETPYGPRSKIEGRVRAGDRVLVIEDLVSTGESSLSAIKTVREAGAVVDWCFAIFDYGFPESRSVFSEKGCTLLSLTDLGALLGVALEKNKISGEEKEIALEWQRDPKGWGSKDRQTTLKPST